MTAYDEVNYPSYCHDQTHPDRLASIAALFGLAAAPVTSARVLELGCGDGSNLIPMATALPGSRFVGIDLAAKPVERGQALIAELCLGNIELHAGSVEQIDAGWGQFDYIIAHGLYSWVPPEVRDHVLRVAKENLAPKGVAFISYAALPGGHARQMMRDMLRFHTRQITDPHTRARQAKGFMQFLAGAQAGVQDEFRALLRAEAESTLKLDEGHVFHDDLAEFNQPFWFTEFIGAARRHQLQFLGEADYFEMTLTPFNESTRRTLASIPDRILREQYLDFLKCRRFRQTLLCHADVALDPEPKPEVITRLHLTSDASPSPAGEVDLRPEVLVRFERGSDSKLQTDYPPGKAAVALLGSEWPRPIHFLDLMAGVRGALENAGLGEHFDDDTPGAVAGFLLQALGAGMVRVHTHSPELVARPGPRPRISALAMNQLQRGAQLTTQRHLSIRLEDEAGRYLVGLMDGSRDAAEIHAAMYRFLDERDVARRPDESAESALARIAAEVDRKILNLARVGLLVA